MKNRNTYIIIPVYNEASVVGQVIKAARHDYDNVIGVNDGSSDDSSNEIVRAGATLVEHPINLGAGAATQTGIDYALQDAAAEYFVTIDADGQHDIRDVATMLAYLKEHKLDVVFGSRFIGEAKNLSPIKRYFLKLAATFSNKTTGITLTDTHVGLRVFNRRFATNLKLTLPGFTHASEIIQRTSEGNYRYAEVPVTITYSDYSKSKGQPMLNAINIAFDLFFHRISKK